MQSVMRIEMNTSRFMIAALLVASSFGMSEPRQAQAQYGWGQNAYYGPAYPRRVRYRYTARYTPRYGVRAGYRAPMNWGANYGSHYGPVASSILPEAYLRPSSCTSNYGAAYYGGGFVSSGSGCNTCGYSACSPCGSGCSSGNCSTGNCATGNCASGNCSTVSGSSYSPDPEPVTNADHTTREVTPTFKPATPEKAPVPDPNDDFVGVNRRENDNESSGGFVAPATSEPPVPSTIPNPSPSTIPSGNSEGSSTIPDNSEVVPDLGGTSTTPMAPITRPMTPAGESTVPGAGGESTIPSGEKTTIPESKPFPVDSSSPSFRTPLKPAPSEPTTEEVVPGLLPETSVKPLRVEPIPVAGLVVERKRVVMQASYRLPTLSRIDVPTQPVLEAGSTKLVIR